MTNKTLEIGFDCTSNSSPQPNTRYLPPRIKHTSMTARGSKFKVNGRQRIAAPKQHGETLREQSVHRQRFFWRIRAPSVTRFEEELVGRQVGHAAAEGDSGLDEVWKFSKGLR
jgi:hypothetical protein